MRLSRGFTLIELAIVLVILGFVGTILVPPIVTSIRHEKRQENKDALISLRHALVGYVRNTKVLPPSDELPAGLSPRDTWTRAYMYKAGVGDVCESNTSTLQVNLNSTTAIRPAFLIASRGQDASDNVNYGAVPIDLSDPKDDLIEYMSLDQLRYLVCERPTGGEPPNLADTLKYTIVGATDVSVGFNSQVTGNVGSSSEGIVLESAVHVDGDVNACGRVTLVSASFVSGDIRSGNAVQLGSGSTVNGSIHAAQGVDIVSTAVVRGDIYAQGDVTVDGEVQGNIYAHGEVTINWNGRVLGNIISTKNITVKNTAANPSVAGNIESKANIELKWGAKIGGDVRAGGVVTKDAGATVGGSVSSGVTTTNPPLPEPPQEIVLPALQPFASTGPDITATNGQTLSPGNYGGVTVRYAQTLVLTGGEYVFKKINLETSTSVKFDLSNGADVVIFVEGDISLPWGFQQLVSLDGVRYSKVSETSPDVAKRVHLETKESFKLDSQVDWMGTVLAQTALSLEYSGFFIGQAVSRGSLSLPSTVTYVYVPSNFSKAHWR